MEDLVTEKNRSADDAAANRPLVEARGLAQRYEEDGPWALDGVDLRLAAGQILGLLGPNGAGKTTLVKILCGLLEPTRGRVWVDNLALDSERHRAQRRIGLVPQEIAVYPTLTVAANLDLWASLYGLAGDARRQRIDDALAVVGLEDRVDTAAGKLSGGLQRRLNIALGLLHDPALLLLDEPTVGVDPDSRRRILDSVRRLCDGGLAVVYSTHYMEEAEAMADELLVLDRGRVVATGTPSAVKRASGLPRRGRVEVDAAATERAAGIAAAHAETVETAPGGILHLSLAGDWRQGGELLRDLEAAAVEVRSFELREPNLEEVFLHLTGRSLDG